MPGELITKAWEPDSARSCCAEFRCQLPFTLVRRRHHCRLCGLVFCSNCCPSVQGSPAGKALTGHYPNSDEEASSGTSTASFAGLRNFLEGSFATMSPARVQQIRRATKNSIERAVEASVTTSLESSQVSNNNRGNVSGSGSFNGSPKSSGSSLRVCCVCEGMSRANVLIPPMIETAAAAEAALLVRSASANSQSLSDAMRWLSDSSTGTSPGKLDDNGGGFLSGLRRSRSEETPLVDWVEGVHVIAFLALDGATHERLLLQRAEFELVRFIAACNGIFADCMHDANVDSIAKSSSSPDTEKSDANVTTTRMLAAALESASNRILDVYQMCFDALNALAKADGFATLQALANAGAVPVLTAALRTILDAPPLARKHVLDYQAHTFVLEKQLADTVRLRMMYCLENVDRNHARSAQAFESACDLCVHFSVAATRSRRRSEQKLDFHPPSVVELNAVVNLLSVAGMCTHTQMRQQVPEVDWQRLGQLRELQLQRCIFRTLEVWVTTPLISANILLHGIGVEVGAGKTATIVERLPSNRQSVLAPLLEVFLGGCLHSDAEIRASTARCLWRLVSETEGSAIGSAGSVGLITPSKPRSGEFSEQISSKGGLPAELLDRIADAGMITMWVALISEPIDLITFYERGGVHGRSNDTTVAALAAFGIVEAFKATISRKLTVDAAQWSDDRLCSECLRSGVLSHIMTCLRRALREVVKLPLTAETDADGGTLRAAVIETIQAMVELLTCLFSLVSDAGSTPSIDRRNSTAAVGIIDAACAHSQLWSILSEIRDAGIPCVVDILKLIDDIRKLNEREE